MRQAVAMEGAEMERWPVEDITEHLQMLASLESASRSFGMFILGHGREWEPQELPRRFMRGTPKACFANCQEILRTGYARQAGLTYVEGYACTAAIRTPVPVLHAWLADGEGRVIDPTWEDPLHSTYFGVPFSLSYVLSTVKRLSKPVSLIDNFDDRWELLRNPDAALQAVERSHVDASLSL